MEKPFEGKATVSETYGGMEIIIPSEKRWGAIIFMCIWMCGWVFGELSAIGVITGTIGEGMRGSQAFMYVWLTGWTFGGLFIMRTLIWSLAGKEIITFAGSQLTIARKGLIPSFTKTYNLNEVKDFRVGHLPSAGLDVWGNERRNLSLSTNTGYLWFDYGMKTIKFGSGIDEAEAKHLLQRMKDKRLIGDKMQTADKTHV